MAWTAPRTWATGELVSSAIMNAHVRDNLNYLFSTTGELSYAQITANVSLGAGGATIVSASAITFDGSTGILIEFWAPDLLTNVGGVTTIKLLDGGSDVGVLGTWTAITQTWGGIYLTRRFTPASGSRTYSIWGSGNTSTLHAGAGGAAVNVPAFIRITRSA